MATNKEVAALRIFRAAVFAEQRSLKLRFYDCLRLHNIVHTSMASWLRIAVVQFAPKMGDVHANMATARKLCRGLAPRSVDLVCFPEMIFTGYMFPDAPSIAPYLEHPQTGPTAAFCAELARWLECYVVAGAPTRLEDGGASESTSALTGANAALLFAPTGHLHHVYHKSNLFPTDIPWARPGAGFSTCEIPGVGRAAVAICNDLNVRAGETWQSLESGPYEFAEFCRAEGVKVVLLLNAWLRPEEGGMEGVGERTRGVREGENEVDEDEDEEDEEKLEPDWAVVNYWATRLRPLWAADDGEAEEVIVVICNRFGRERGKVFAGSSAMFSMRRGSGKPRLLHVMGAREEGVSVWNARPGKPV